MVMHRCPGRGCSRSIGANELACPRHWRELPERLRRTIKTSYRHDDTPTPAISAAIEFLSNCTSYPDTSMTSSNDGGSSCGGGE